MRTSSLCRIGPPLEPLPMVPLLADRLRERAANVAGLNEPGDHSAKVPLRPPAEVAARERVVIDPVDAGEHPPASPRVFVFPSRRAPSDDGGRVGTKAGKVFAPERRGGADDIFSERDRGRAFGRQKMRVHYIFDRGAPEKELVHLGVVVGKSLARLRVVILLRKEARGPEDHAGELLVAMKEPAEI